ncbi:MAG: CHAP domain-containing protein [Flavobacteriales bacterium]|nr:CHAP domain-containing protein [Flavobacteriales bacterium]
MRSRLLKWLAFVLVLIFGIYWAVLHVNINPTHHVGEVVDEFQGVKVYYNGGVNHVEERNLSVDGYNLGLKYQCVEFVKRFYLEHFKHRMRNSYGHAFEFFDRSLKDGDWNSDRALIQYSNGSSTKPVEGDIIIFDRYLLNRYGHVAIISQVSDGEIEIVQQNPGPFHSSREKFELLDKNNRFTIVHPRVLGWLRHS